MQKQLSSWADTFLFCFVFQILWPRIIHQRDLRNWPRWLDFIQFHDYQLKGYMVLWYFINAIEIYCSNCYASATLEMYFNNSIKNSSTFLWQDPFQRSGIPYIHSTCTACRLHTPESSVRAQLLSTIHQNSNISLLTNYLLLRNAVLNGRCWILVQALRSLLYRLPTYYIVSIGFSFSYR